VKEFNAVACVCKLTTVENSILFLSDYKTKLSELALNAVRIYIKWSDK
jgi:hypothetical protein